TGPLGATCVRGKVALVTGGAGGLGEAICRALGAAGARVVVADVREEPAERVARAVVDDGGEALALRLDLRDDAQAAEALERAARHFDGLDVLVNNAGADVTLPVEELSVAEWDRILDVNLRGPFLMSRLAFPLLK